MKLRIPRLSTLIIGICVVLLGAAQAYAGSVSNATVVQVQPLSPNVFFVYVNVATSGAPACATYEANRYVVDLTTEAGKAMVATLLTAYSLKSPVDIWGTGSCSVWGDTETYYIVAH